QQNTLLKPNNATAEPVLGESLAMLGFNWIATVTRSEQLLDRLGGTSTLWRYGVGIIGMQAPPAGTQLTGPYVDLPLNFTAPIQRNDRPFANEITSAEETTFFAGIGLASAFENGVIEQTQPGAAAVSTVMLLDRWAQQGAIVDINNNVLPGDDRNN